MIFQRFLNKYCYKRNFVLSSNSLEVGFNRFLTKRTNDTFLLLSPWFGCHLKQFVFSVALPSPNGLGGVVASTSIYRNENEMLSDVYRIFLRCVCEGGGICCFVCVWGVFFLFFFFFPIKYSFWSSELRQRKPECGGCNFWMHKTAALILGDDWHQTKCRLSLCSPKTQWNTCEYLWHWVCMHIHLYVCFVCAV